MNTLRCEGGISGFPKAEESEHDAFIGGHSSISISAALGIAEAMRSDGDDHSVVAVIGDGALTGGEAYEGLNNAGKSRCNLIVVLNDNEMSISKIPVRSLCIWHRYVLQENITAQRIP